MSLGEICSKYPTSSGTYSWSFQLASFKHRILLSWINGWLITVGYWVLTLSVTFVRDIPSSYPSDPASLLLSLSRAPVNSFCRASTFFFRSGRPPHGKIVSSKSRVLDQPPRWLFSPDLIFVLVVVMTTGIAICFDHNLPFLDVSKQYNGTQSIQPPNSNQAVAAVWNLLGTIGKWHICLVSSFKSR